MSLSKGLSRLQKRVHQTGQKVKKTLAQLCCSPLAKKEKCQRNKLRKKRRPTEFSEEKSSKTNSPRSDDNNSLGPTTSTPPTQDASLQSASPYDRVAHTLCQALIDHIRAHYLEPPSPTCSCSVCSTSECDRCHSESPACHAGATSVTSAELRKAEVISPPECYYINRSMRRKEIKHKKSTVAPRVLSSQVQSPPLRELSISQLLSSQIPPAPRRKVPVRDPPVPLHPSTYSCSTSPYRTVSWYPPSQRLPVTGYFYRATQYENYEDRAFDYNYEPSRAATLGHPLPEPELYDTQIFAWLREIPEVQQPLRRKPKLDNMSPRNGSRVSGLGAIIE